MPKVITETNSSEDIPDALRPFLFHGVDLSWNSRDREATGECPFCNAAGKFTANVHTGLWHCWSCCEGAEEKGNTSGGGNPTFFLQRLLIRSFEATEDYSELIDLRGGIISEETFNRWECAKSISSGHWLIPGYNLQGGTAQIYRYTKTPSGKYRLFVTPEANGHFLHGVHLRKNRSRVFLCEGVFDAMLLWQKLSQTKQDNDGVLKPTGSIRHSLLQEIDVLATAGANIFKDNWCELFAGKQVTLCFDNDHPRTANGREIEGAGISGVKRIASLLSSSRKRPMEISYLSWGPEGYDLELENGFDLTDLLTS